MIRRRRGRPWRQKILLWDIDGQFKRFTFEEGHILVRRGLELDDPPLSTADEALLEVRLAEHRAGPGGGQGLYL